MAKEVISKSVLVDKVAEAAEKADETASESEADVAEPEATEPADTTEE